MSEMPKEIFLHPEDVKAEDAVVYSVAWDKGCVKYTRSDLSPSAEGVRKIREALMAGRDACEAECYFSDVKIIDEALALLAPASQEEKP